MPVITNGRFCPSGQDCAPFDADERLTEIEVASDTDPATLLAHLDWLTFVTVLVPSSHDGRGFSIAARLREAGYKGHLRAKGHVLADQYPHALRSGFDDVEIGDELAERMPEAQWLDAFSRVTPNYQDRLRGTSEAGPKVALAA